MRIDVTEDGPYLVDGVPLTRAEIVANEAGESVAYRETQRFAVTGKYALCRCGMSQNKPFCDGSHLDVGFDGTETAGHDSYAETSACIDGPGVRLRDVRHLCAEARFCDRGGGLWNLIEKADDPAVRDLVEEEATLCPSGRYVACDPETDSPHDPTFEPSITLLEDPSMGVSGPLFVRGKVPIFDADGVAYEVRNRVTLCRCGHSANKPFCDGSHIASAFHDESATEAVDD